jgi:hypothetical protein
MRNVAFSLMLIAMALLQVAVVSTELSQSNVQTATVAKGDAAGKIHAVKG